MKARCKALQIIEADGSITRIRKHAANWMSTLDSKAEGIVLKRIHRIADGLFGDCRGVGQGVSELRIDYGPAYRVYFGQNGNTVYLISGGTKRTQQRDIDAAQKFWSDYEE
jgi:putative addiction module killer protein